MVGVVRQAVFRSWGARQHAAQRGNHLAKRGRRESSKGGSEDFVPPGTFRRTAMAETCT